MILAGVDEAGYGPVLGPLVVGCCAFRLDGCDGGDLPCVWKRLTKLVSKKRLTSGKKLHVNDSKLVYSPATGLKELERSILTIAHACGEPVEGLEGLLGRVAPHVLAELPKYPWYEPVEDEAFPIEQDGLSLRLFANGLRAEMDRTGTHCVHLGARVILERELNRMIEATRNKSSVLFSTAAIHLDHLIRTYGDQGLVIFCDRQGGRARYGPLLRLMFEEWSLEVTDEHDGHSDYTLHRGPHAVRILFCEKAEAQCLPVAVASMLSKYLREALMRRFNAYWSKLIPDLSPTAGYHPDGIRFLGDIDAKRRELGIADDVLVRSR